MPGTTPARELASSAVMSFCMNNIAVEIALATPLIERITGTTPDHTQLLLTFIFITLPPAVHRSLYPLGRVHQGGSGT